MSLEGLLVTHEISLGLLVVPVARAAYNRGDFDLADAVRARGEAAYFRANRLLYQVSNDENQQLRGDLERLQRALDQIKQNPSSSESSRSPVFTNLLNAALTRRSREVSFGNKLATRVRRLSSLLILCIRRETVRPPRWD